MRGFLGNVGALARGNRRSRRCGQFLIHGLADVRFVQAGGQPIAHGLADAPAGRVLLPNPADHGRIRSDFHAPGWALR
jgi:hypothetical protein